MGKLKASTKGKLPHARKQTLGGGLGKAEPGFAKRKLLAHKH